MLGLSLRGLIERAGDVFTSRDSLLQTTQLPVIGELNCVSFARSKCRVDSTFEDFLVGTSRGDLLQSFEFQLSQVGRVDSLLAEIKKYDRVYVNPPSSVSYFSECALLHVCKTWAQLSLCSSVPTLCLLAPEPALLSMDLSRSPGYPWRRYAPSKQGLVDHPTAVNLLWDRVDHIWKVLRGQSDEILGLWYAFLKEELRPLEKMCLPVPKIRSISGAPVDLSIVGNQLCHDFNEMFYSFHSEPLFGSVVGMSPFHGGWDRLCRQHWHTPDLVRESSVSIDVTQWDRSFSPFLFDLVVRLRQMITSSHGSDELVAATAGLRRLYRDVVGSAVVVPLKKSAEVVLLSAGMKSGWVNTTTDNTLGHMLLLITFMFHQGIANEIGRGVCFSLYGDDNLLSWSASLDHIFQPGRIESWYGYWGFKTHGVTITRGSERYNQVFLGGSFAVCPVTQSFVYKPESGQKAIDGVRFRFTDYNTTFQRVCSLRVLHFYNVDAFSVLDQYAKFLTSSQLVSRELIPNYLDRYSIVALHTGRESSDGCLFAPDLDTVLLPEDRCWQHRNG